MCYCTSESKRSLRVVIANLSGFNARMELGIAWKKLIKMIASCCIWEFEWIQGSNGARDCMEGGFIARMGLGIAWKVCQVMSKQIMN
ncbi:uncharacterized protein G2W53_004354 [Senna tora]|uniref:Uncharacterized protein n=1 Tax=Senna tora TaxID=362788 RepID=A0A835CHW9_9FABA|nr:uncharacterized protein G2W53_004354 [Senna tora]